MDPLRLALLLIVVGEPPPDDLSRIAQDALSRGFDSPSLRQMAGTAAAGHDAVFRVAHELGWEVPDDRTARLELARYWAREIVTGHLSPIEGARRIEREASEQLDDAGEFRVFAALVRQWDAETDRRPQCERRIVEEAGLVLADTA